MKPPIMVALSENFSPSFLPKTSPPKQITKVNTPMIKEDSKAAGKLYSAVVKPTESASMEVAIPCTIRTPKVSFLTPLLSFSSLSPGVFFENPSQTIFPPIKHKSKSEIQGMNG